MRAFITNHIWLVLFLSLVVLHLITVFAPLASSTFTARTQSDETNLVITNRASAFSEERVSNFSKLFGIEPVSFAITSEEPEAELIVTEVKRLNAYNPVLIAIDEIDNIQTARLLLVDENQNRLTSARLGDVLHGYKVAQITLNSVTFELLEPSENSALPAQIALTIFSRNKQNAN